MKCLQRKEAIDALRSRLQTLTDDDHSACEVAGRLGMFCHGFKQWSFDELKQRFDWLVKNRPDITRDELERLANIWELSQKQRHDLPLACDVQAMEHDTCRGWDEFTNEQLADFLAEFGEGDVQVLGERAPGTGELAAGG